MKLARLPFKRLERWWRALSNNGKLLVYVFAFNTVVMVGAGTMEYNRRKQILQSYQKALSQTETMGNKSSSLENTQQPYSPPCFVTARLFRDNCSYLTPEGLDEDAMCVQLEQSLEMCRDDLYKHIPVDKPPAMLPINGIVNLPPWISQTYKEKSPLDTAGSESEA